MRIDFHTHTKASDGALAPATLLQRAELAGVEALAITDHDTLSGYADLPAAADLGLKLVRGVELSCVWSGITIHVVGLGFDASDPDFAALLSELDAAREARAHTIAERMQKRGMPGALEGALAKAGSSQIGRPHFAAWMVEQGHVADVASAFDRHLGQGKAGDVKAHWPTLKAVVEALAAAGGVPVLAHPLGYKMTRTKLNALCADFREAGGYGIEVVSGRQPMDEVQRLRALARTFGFAASLGSDFHRDGTYAPELGVETSLAGDLPGVWEALL